MLTRHVPARVVILLSLCSPIVSTIAAAPPMLTILRAVSGLRKVSAVIALRAARAVGCVAKWRFRDTTTSSSRLTAVKSLCLTSSFPTRAFIRLRQCFTRSASSHPSRINEMLKIRLKITRLIIMCSVEPV